MRGGAVPRSIGARLILIIGLTAAGTLCAGFAVVIFNDVKAFRADMVDNTVLVARVVGEYSASDLVFEDAEGATLTLDKLNDVPDIEYACLVDNTGAVFAVYGRPDGSERPVGAFEPAVVSSGGSLHVVEPVAVAGERYGALYLRASTAGLEAKITRHVLTMIGLLGVLVAVALVIASRLQRIISGPILALARTTRRISETGDHTIRVSRCGGGEIAVLCDGFNEMLDQIHLRQLERDAAELRTREKSQFLAAMSHELRTPLNAIIGFSEILLRKGTGFDGKQQRFLGNILNSGQHLLRIINDILDLSKVEAGKMEFAPELIEVRDTIDGVITVMKGAAQKRSIQFRVQVLGELPVIEADPVKLKQILFNLASNAVKFSNEDSVVRIVAQALQPTESPLGVETVAIDFIDHGIGIAADDLEKIFQPFRQADSGADRRFGGTGLGLPLVKAFVEQHGGLVLVESVPEEGSTFTVLLPCRFRGSGLVVAVADGVAEDGGEQVLVVEDDPETMDRIRSELQAAGYQVNAARSAEQALASLARTVPAAIILDIVLPGADGWDVLRQIKMNRKTSGTPVVIYSKMENRELGLALGADDYFLKPLGLEKMVFRLDQLLKPERREEERLLLIDDDSMVLQQLEARLVPLGFRLDYAATGAEGLARAEQDAPALIILDLMMEGMDGFEVAMRLRSNQATAHIPIVAITSADLSRRERDRLNGKIAALLHKGEEERRSLVPVVRRLLARRRRLQRAAVREPGTESP